jgi:hypothetical protein
VPGTAPLTRNQRKMAAGAAIFSRTAKVRLESVAEIALWINLKIETNQNRDGTSP